MITARMSSDGNKYHLDKNLCLGSKDWSLIKPRLYSTIMISSL
jgi:hypothetical protein